MEGAITDLTSEYQNYSQIYHYLPLQGSRIYVAVSYIIFNIIGFVVNLWVLYVVFPLLFTQSVRVPKSILFYIMTLCFSDLFIMIGMVFLISDFILGTWIFSEKACTTYLIFDSLNKFMAPIIALLISRTCYATVCLKQKYQERAANLKFAMLQIILCLLIVMIVLWPVFAYTGVYTFYLNPNHTKKSILVMRKCSFQPPQTIQMGFNIVACIANYAIPLGGILYWYMSVPFFLRRRAETTLVGKTGISETAIKKVITTALVLTFVYVLCWSPYWIFLFAHQQLTNTMQPKTLVIISYFIHLLPYISCSAYPMIFTLLNRAIQHAHAQMIRTQRRRFKSITDDAARQVRQRLRIFGIEKHQSSPISNNKRSATELSSNDASNINLSRITDSLFSLSNSNLLDTRNYDETTHLTVPLKDFIDEPRSDNSEISL